MTRRIEFPILSILEPTECFLLILKRDRENCLLFFLERQPKALGHPSPLELAFLYLDSAFPVSLLSCPQSRHQYGSPSVYNIFSIWCLFLKYPDDVIAHVIISAMKAF